MMRMYGVVEGERRRRARAGGVRAGPRAVRAQRAGRDVPRQLEGRAQARRDRSAPRASIPSHEAVIVSDGGVTKDAALAYVMLEKLGQKKVSIFMDSLESVDSLDRMSRTGFARRRRTPTIVGKPRSPPRWPCRPRPMRACTRARSRGERLVSEGLHRLRRQRCPRAAVDGKVVHVPYTELLEARRHAQGREGHLGDPRARRACRATPSSSPSPTIRARRRPTTTS